ncbi:MAG: hypothetical protein FRX49_09964 [Trebouxia sp. A1-2]|nr:MAG: hypothetical protein FRX49_09964 [Trebouxia sp. A1-2]
MDTHYCKSNANATLTWECLAALQEVAARGGSISAEGGTQPGGSCCPHRKGCESSLGVLVHGEITLVNSGTVSTSAASTAMNAGASLAATFLRVWRDKAADMDWAALTGLTFSSESSSGTSRPLHPKQGNYVYRSVCL